MRRVASCCAASRISCGSSCRPISARARRISPSPSAAPAAVTAPSPSSRSCVRPSRDWVWRRRWSTATSIASDRRMNLDDPRALAQADPHDARLVLAEFPAQCRAARMLRAAPALTARRPRVVIVAGMGGSAAAGDVLAACAADTADVPVLVHRGYGLPAVAGPDALVVVVSYSGDTAEALSAFDEAVARRVPVVALTAGGALAERATARRLPRVALPSGLMPRMALGYMFLPAVA